MNRFIEAIRNMFRIEDLRSRVLFTLALLGVYRIGAHIPTPGINVSALLDHMSNANLGRHNMGITSAGARFGFRF